MQVMTYFSADIDRALLNWVEKDTWYTNHQLDEHRFYQFVHALMISGWVLDESAFTNKVTRAINDFHPNFDPAYRDRKVNEARVNMVAVYEYRQANYIK